MADANPPDAAHRGDTGPFGGPVLDADVICPSVGQLHDSWEEIDGEVWTELRDPSSSACAVEAVAGRLELASAEGTVACGLASATCFDITDRAIMIDAIEPGDGVPEPFLRLALAGGGAVEMRVVTDPDGRALLDLSRDGESLLSEELDPERDRLWRMMHTEVAGRLDFQTTEEGTTDWTTRASTDVGAEETIEVQVIVGVAGSGEPVDAAAFEDLIGIDF
ncbi:MAG TPA: hypothetical protein VIG06_24195 [Kofleriaceae bacterium]